MKQMHKLTGVGAAAAVAALAISLGVAAPARADYSWGTYSHSNPNVTCEVDTNALNQVTGRSITIDSPLVGSPRAQQQATYQVIVFRWNGSAWAYDNQLAPLGGLVGTSVWSRGLPDNSGFTVNTPGYYRIAIKYAWYWNGLVEQSQYAWAGVHTQFFTHTNGSVTTMGYGITGDYCYIR